MTNGKLIAGIIILVSSLYRPVTGIGGLEWIVFLAQIVIGSVLIVRARAKKAARD